MPPGMSSLDGLPAAAFLAQGLVQHSAGVSVPSVPLCNTHCGDHASMVPGYDGCYGYYANCNPWGVVW
eukprot:14187643-Alexandrium_andersonii.AAC.1